MTMGTKTAVLAFLLTVASATGVATGASAQEPERERERDCRCVDGDGTELEDCVCVRMPDVQGILAGSLPGLDRPRLGISVMMTEPSEQAEGARITDVLEDGPAERAGLREGDVVTRLDGHALTAPLDNDLERDLDPDRALPPQRLLALVREIEPGDEVEVEYLRDGETRRTTVEAEEIRGWGSFTVGWDSERFGEEMRALGDRMRALRSLEAPHPPGAPRAFRFDGPDAPDAPGAFRFEGLGGDAPVWFEFQRRFGGGLELVRVNPELGTYFGTDRGVLVASVPDGSALGLRPGDVILEIDGRAAEDPERVRSILASYDPEEAITFHVRRDGREVDVSGRVGDGAGG